MHAEVDDYKCYYRIIVVVGIIIVEVVFLFAFF